MRFPSARCPGSLLVAETLPSSPTTFRRGSALSCSATLAQKQRSEDKSARDRTRNAFAEKLFHAVCTPRIPMVEPADTGHGHKSGRSCCPSLHRPPLGGFFPQPIMRAALVIVADVFMNQPAPMSFVEDDHMVQQFSAATPTQRSATPFCHGLP